MEVNKIVYVIFDYSIFTKEDIVLILKEEEYKSFFYMGVFRADVMLDSDEVWTFGNVDNREEYIFAVNNSLDIWVMG